MKKLLALLLSVCMMLTLVACGGGDTNAGDTGDTGDAAGTTDAGGADVESVKISIATPTADGNPMQDLVY